MKRIRVLFCAAFGLSAFVQLLAAATPPVDLTDAEIARRFQARRAEIIAEAIGRIAPGDTAAGGGMDVAAALQAGLKRDAALARFAKLNEPTPTGNMFWMYPMAAIMANERGQFDEATQARVKELWRTYWPSRGDTENHWVLYYASLYIAAQTMPDAGPEAWSNGKSSAENMAEARSYLEHWMEVTTSYGQGEYDSPSYIGEYTAPLALLTGWCQDPVLRQKARMMLDYIYYDYLVEQVGGFYGGAHSRVYPRQLLQPARTAASMLGWYLFGLGGKQVSDRVLLLALSGYTPPPMFERIARDDAARPYAQIELKRTRWRMRHAGPESFVIGDRRTIPVYKYSYVDRDYILGSSQGGLLQPIQQQTWSLIWRVDENPLDASNAFFTVHPYSSPIEGTMYFSELADTVTNLIVRSKVDYDSPDKLASGSPYEQVFQEGAALIGLYDIPEGTRFPHIITFFSRDLVNTAEDASGWIFSQGGPVYIAYRPFAPGEWKPNDWTDLLKGGGGGWISTGFREWGLGHRNYVSASLRNGYVMQVAPVRAYASFDAFKDAVRKLPLKFSLSGKPEATFTSLDGSVLHARYGEAPSVNGKGIDFARWPLYSGPFGHADRGSEQLEIKHGGERYFLDFKATRTEQTSTNPAP